MISTVVLPWFTVVYRGCENRFTVSRFPFPEGRGVTFEPSLPPGVWEHLAIIYLANQVV